MTQYDLAVLGGGPGGYVAALRAAQLGAQVVVVEQDRVGGTCLNIGCIPTKVLTTATELLLKINQAQAFGITTTHAAADLPALMDYKRTTVDTLVNGVEQLLKQRNITLVRGSGYVIRPNTLRVTHPTGDISEISARHIILAPGSITAPLPIPGSDLPGVITSTEALEITEIPARLLVIGGGVIGLEFACIHEALGSQVTILEMMPTLLPNATDEALAKRLALLLRRRGMKIYTNAKVQVIESIGKTLCVTYTNAAKEERIEADRVLIAVGRLPNTQGIGLKELGLKLNGLAIAVDETLATNLPNVWAIGDAVGGMMLAHKAMVEGRVVAENITGSQRKVDYRSVPNVIFTRPEIASVGLTEREAREQGADIRITQFPFSANPRARILGETDGIVKLVCEADSGRILGVHLMGPHATDLIAEGALSVQMGATADDLAWTTHAHPTLPESMLEAALGFRDATLHFHTR
ncbi:MAG: dihydrolipoyl dehydrogenase [Anaerolineae bacterium]|nr:dihydrolipoyl dehydrogenase [Anaerolineae bacterium]